MEAHQARGYMEERRHGSRLKPPGSAGNMPTKLLNWIVDCIMCETGDLGPGKMERVRVAAGPRERERGILTGPHVARR